MFETVGAPAGLAVLQGEHRRGPDVDAHGNQEADAHDPEERAEVVQELRVAVDLVRVSEDLQVAHEVADDERDQDQAGNGHQDFPTDRRAEERANKIHRENSLSGWKRKAARASNTPPGM